MSNSVCLTMIERDEAKVLPRSLASFRALAGIEPNYCIVDGGSEDGSIDLIAQEMAGIPGEVHLIPQPKPLDDFAGARNGSIDRARLLADWMLFLDADDEIATEPGFVMPKLKGDAYKILVKIGDLEFWRLALVSSKRGWRYVGRMHENLEGTGPYKEAEKLTGLWIQVHPGEGARSADPVQKFVNDAAVLRQCLVDDPGNLRHLFYLGQSLRDAGALPAALDVYRDRAAHVEGWPEETYFALLQVARILGWLNRPLTEVVAAFVRAHAFRPSRGGETLGLLAEYLRSKQEWLPAMLASAFARQVPRPDDILFVTNAWYAWKAQDEFAIAAYYAGDHTGSREACLALLINPALPESESPRVQTNLAFAEKALG